MAGIFEDGCAMGRPKIRFGRTWSEAYRLQPWYYAAFCIYSTANSITIAWASQSQ